MESSTPARTPEPKQKSEAAPPRQEASYQAEPAARESDGAEAAPTDESGSGAKPAGEEKPDCEFAEADAPVEAITDPAAGQVVPITTAMVPDPTIVSAPAIPVVLASAAINAEGSTEASEKSAASEATAAPVMANAGEASPQSEKTEDKSAPLAKSPLAKSSLGKTTAAKSPLDGAPHIEAPLGKAPVPGTDGEAENASAGEEIASAGQPPASSLPAKPETPQQHVAGPKHETADDKSQAQPAVGAEGAAPVAKSEPQATQVTTHVPVAAHSAAISAAHPQSAPAIVSQPVPVNALAVEIAGQARAGNSRFEIRLDPPELGRIDVRLDVDRDGNVTSRLMIERADTYDLLRRDQSTLERALQQAGLKTSDNALEFQLRDQGFGRQQQDETSSRGNTALIADAEASPAEAASGYARLLRAGSGIDIRV